MAVIMLSPAASAADITEDLPYSAYSYNNSDKPVALPAPYTVTKTLIGEDMETAPFTDLNDIFYDGADTVYICDSGNNRIVITDTDFKIKKSSLILKTAEIATVSAPREEFMQTKI